jgi:hypothetical protein
MAVKPTALALRSGKTYSPSFSGDDITYAEVSAEDLDELMKLAGKQYGVTTALVSVEGASDEGSEVTIGE